MLEMPELWNICQGELRTGVGTSPRERSVLWSTKLNRVGDLKSILISDMGMQSLEFALLILGLALVQYFLTMFPLSPFDMIICILCILC